MSVVEEEWVAVEGVVKSVGENWVAVDGVVKSAGENWVAMDGVVESVGENWVVVDGVVESAGKNWTVELVAVDTAGKAVEEVDTATDIDEENQMGKGKGSYHWPGQESESKKTQTLHPVERLRHHALWVVRW
jgi:FKBP-type peptidyl-prolyl cis-trans isomerase 2